jgi:hypothetical protein
MLKVSFVRGRTPEGCPGRVQPYLLLRAICTKSAYEVISMVWQAFFDESGESEHSPVLVLGGFLAPYVRWQKFTKQWKLMLGKNPDIKYFKMNEAEKLRGQFRGWSEKDKNERVRLAYRTIEDHVSFQVSCIVDIEALHRIVPKEELGGRKQPNPYYVAFSAIITKITQYQRMIGVSEKIDFIFDERVMKNPKSSTAGTHSKTMRLWTREIY